MSHRRSSFAAGRRALLALVILLATLPVARGGAAQGNATPAASPCAAGTVADNRALVDRYWRDIWTAGGEAKVPELLAPDEIHHWGIGGDTQGLEPFTTRLRAFLFAFPDVRFTVEESFGQGDLVVSRWTATATHRGTWLTVPATNTSVTWSGINIFRIACGRVAESWGSADHIGLLQQIGGLPLSATASPVAGEASPVVAAGSPEACAATSAEENVAIARRWTEEALSGHNLAVLDEIVAADAVHHPALFADQRGPAAIRRALAALLAAFPDITFTVDLTVADGDLVAVRWTGRGTHQGSFMGKAPTGNRVEFSGINVYRVACGRIAEGWSEADGLSLFQQLGGGPPARKPEVPAA